MSESLFRIWCYVIFIIAKVLVTGYVFIVNDFSLQHAHFKWIHLAQSGVFNILTALVALSEIYAKPDDER